MTSISLAADEQDYNAFASLVRDYTGWLSVRLASEAWFMDAVLKHQSLDIELATLETTYGPPNGQVLLARHDGGIAGGVAFRRLGAGVCEMKRMFVRDRFRGLGLGRNLCRAVMESARNEGYGLMQLDTSHKLTEAIALYQSLGFRECPPYRDYPPDLLPHLYFMEASLDTP